MTPAPATRQPRSRRTLNSMLASEGEIHCKRLRRVDRDRLDGCLPFRGPHAECVRTGGHVVDSIVAVTVGDGIERVLQHDDVGLHLWMDATELHVSTGR